MISEAAMCGAASQRTRLEGIVADVTAAECASSSLRRHWCPYRMGEI
jgi:hypothetical protein